MTNEEAIAYGKDYLMDLISAACEISEKHKEFVKMAIAALKAQPCECCMSVKAVMQILTELGYGDEENGADAEYMSALCDVAEKVKELSRDTTLKLDGMLEDAYEHGYQQARYDYEVQPGEDCVSKAIETIVTYCSERTCNNCRLYSSEGCVFKCGYPHQWLEVQEELKEGAKMEGE